MGIKLGALKGPCVGVVDGAVEGASEDTWDGVKDTLRVGTDVDQTVGVPLKTDGRYDEDGSSDEPGDD